MIDLSIYRAFLFTFALVISSFVSADPIDINTAAVDELVSLVGIGPSKAKLIVLYRTEHGPFKSINQLVEVKGIGESTLKQNQDRIIAVIESSKAMN